MTDDPEVALPSEEVTALREILTDHEVRFAVVFGSAGRPDGDPADVDLAVEFAECLPTDDGYTDTYLRLHSALENELGRDVDLVDVHSMSPRFASVVFDDGVRILGTVDRRHTLAEQLAGESQSVGDARKRVAAAVARLQEGSS
ncbi:nucleotidyltransferase family protein [Natronorubrum sp. FCH18a]|uniref:nucleotidyltransferase family protein n=1 Tax=Natronorubrum sp. FCH18a TaxID=3447018 RepID=UPI003F50ED42